MYQGTYFENWVLQSTHLTNFVLVVSIRMETNTEESRVDDNSMTK